jgi:flagellin-like protein
MNQQDRAVTPVISTILMVAIVIVLAATVSVFFLGVTEGINEPAPVVGQTSGEFEPGADAQRVRVTHIAGESIPAEELEVVVRASGPDVDAEARLVNLPEFDEEKDPENIISSFNDEIESNDPNTWGVGDTIQFEINVGGADFREPPVDSSNDADKLTVLIVHTPSEAVIVRKTFTP